ncbi:alkylation response protein AidB-like acyl-CoA dehydrogenase [Thermocatellispora tengchongensis]|uniref:Alkylation response protein AidB-like acyl-CoA dehydrogenase n=1 Tax=Thermocatellispora tengchongensis TaxID=1073253 RepID=A0A840PDT9_9ACTN|nr:acyl-CoA dehydrogenase family protein [Thermocatellispora tengchongensis]MBB5137362.1 alkylation response protein AidB-like acyl-CoA dehydrogenase [Thermocatellispora tengchongensis]
MTDGTTESVESFRLRARAWLAANMPRAEESAPAPGDELEAWHRARELQRKLYEGGFAGICYPAEYGGLGLTPAHQRAFTEEADGYEMPLLLNIPTLSICLPTILDMGSEEHKREHIGAVLRGEEVLVQFLSEPSGGSDLAGLLTRAELDGDTWILNGAKTWSSSAYAGDYALCLARTDPTVPKHHGLTMFLMPTKGEGITMNRVAMVDGTAEFCEEFFDNVRLPASAVVGEVNGGWAVATRQLYHERTAMGGGSPYVSGRGFAPSRKLPTPIDVARAAGRAGDPEVRELIGEWLATSTVSGQTAARVTRAIAGGHLPPAAASLMRLMGAEAMRLERDVAMRVAGACAAVAAGDEPGVLGEAGIGYLMRQGSSLGGGSVEMSRNIVSERLLGMPREYAADRGVPFNQVRRGRA